MVGGWVGGWRGWVGVDRYGGGSVEQMGGWVGLW